MLAPGPRFVTPRSFVKCRGRDHQVASPHPGAGVQGSVGGGRDPGVSTRRSGGWGKGSRACDGDLRSYEDSVTAGVGTIS